MKTTIKILSCLVGISTLGMNMTAQVGIGIANPHPNAILDMTNINNKRVVMPRSSVTPTTSATDTVGMLIYYNDGLYLRDSVAFNHINPWKYKYNGATAQGISFNPASLVGVGVGINTVDLLGYLHVSATGKEVLATGNSAALFIGNTTTGSHMIFDADEIMVKTGPATGGTLKLQEGKGNVQLGQDILNNSDSAFSYLHTKIGSATQNKSLTVYGNANVVGKVKESGNDLLPSGSIIMWSGSTIPAGWKLCNGAAGTPDLRNRMIYGGEPLGINYNTAQGSNTRALTIANLPAHVHTGTTNDDGSHTHDYKDRTVSREDVNGSNFNNQGINGVPDNTRTTGNVGSSHTHAFTTSGCSGCNTTPVDVRSAYFVLAFIMKI